MTVLFRRDSYRADTGLRRPLNHVHHSWKGAVTTMSIVAHAHPFVVGVDTHARNHVYAIWAAAHFSDSGPS